MCRCFVARRVLPALAALWIGPAVFPATAPALILYVGPTGSDQWSGRLAEPNANRTDGPLASLQGARDAIRGAKAKRPLSAPVEVVIADGRYELPDTLEFTAADSGSEQAPITYAAAPDAHPVFSGGRRITGWRRTQSGAWVTQVPDVAAGRWYFEQLFVHGRRATRARSPNDGYFYMLRRRNERVDPNTGKITLLNNRSFEGRPEDLRSLNGLDRLTLADAVLTVFHSWTVSLHRLADVESEAVTFTNAARWPLLNMGPSQRYRIENVPGALDAPGEWFLARDGALTYLPLPEDDLASAEVIAPRLECLIRLAGGSQWLEWLNFRGLTFQHADYHVPPDGFVDNQAAVMVGAAVEADAVRHVTLKDCEVAHVGTYAVWFRRRCQDCQVAGSRFQDLGAGGVKIGDGNVHPDPLQQTTRIAVEDSVIADGGQIHTGAVGIWVGQSPLNRLLRNEISNLPYSGISLGWRWDYGPTASLTNTVESNHIHHLGWGVLSDLGGIYNLGVATGSVFRKNVIHDLLPYDYYGHGGWGIYLDAASSGITVENNLIYNTKSGALHLHFGRDIVVRNNIFAWGAEAQVVFSRPEPHLSLTFEHNLLYGRGGTAFLGPWNKGNIRSDRNLFWDVTGDPIRIAAGDLAAWQKLGRDTHSLVADPRFENPDRFDFTLRTGSPAIGLGFRPFEFDTVRGTRERARRTVELTRATAPTAMPPPPKPPPPPLLRIQDGFEATPVNAAPLDARCFVRGQAAITVSADRAATGAHSLKIQDAAGLEYPWEPFLSYAPDYTSGTARCEFDVYLTRGALLRHEWRDGASPYHIGPSFVVHDGGLYVGSRNLMPLPVEQWIHLAVTTRLGKRGDGNWSLEVTPPRGKTQSLAPFPMTRGDFRSAAWVGFISLATNATAVYLDNLRLENTPEGARSPEALPGRR